MKNLYPMLATRAVISAVMFAFALPAAAQEAGAQLPPAGNQIVVTAQRSGAPLWTVHTDTGTVILVGEIRAVPKATPWQPDRLEEAVGEADSVIIRARPKFSPGDVFRLIFRGGRFTKLPNDTVAADYLNADQRARLAVLEEQYDQDYDRRSLLMTAFDLLARRLDFDDDTTDDATDIVREAAEDADVPITRPQRFRGEDLLDNLAEAPPESHIPCLEAAMAATEAGGDVITRRGDDWRARDVPAVMANPLEIALGTCWPWADPQLGEELRGIWVDAIETAAADTGVTVAAVPLRVLAEQGGVLDLLEQRGFEIGGPIWR